MSNAKTIIIIKTSEVLETIISVLVEKLIPKKALDFKNMPYLYGYLV